MPSADSDATYSANNEVEKAVTACKRGKKRGAYVRYSDQQRAKIEGKSLNTETRRPQTSFRVS